MTRAIRRVAAAVALAAFAFAQIAVSAYACTMAAQPVAQVQPETHPQGGCPELSTANLCEQHCDYGSAAVGGHADTVPAPDLAPLPWGVSSASLADPPSHVPARHLARPATAPPPGRPLPLRI
jgi:hypothetical protein